MQFDNGEVLPGLDESWTFLGANLMEWSSGLMVFMMISLLGDNPARLMPFMVSGLVLTAYSLAGLRSMFPDQERGVKHAVLTSIGVKPPDIPAPASLQAVWGATPVSELDEESEFVKSGLASVYPSFTRQFLDDFEQDKEAELSDVVA